MMKSIVLFLGLILVTPVLLDHAFAVDFVDSTGYIPSWAENGKYPVILLACTEIVGDNTRDGNWCMEWVTYVSEQGAENFPESTSGKTATISSSMLTSGELYSGSLTKLLPTRNSFDKSWVIGLPTLSLDQKEFFESQGVAERVGQGYFAPDVWDKGENGILSWLQILEFENVQLATTFFQSATNLLENQMDSSRTDFSNLLVGETLTFAKCYGYVENKDLEDEQVLLYCLKGKYVLRVESSQIEGYVTGPNGYDLFSEEIVRDISKVVAEKIINDIDSTSTTNKVETEATQITKLESNQSQESQPKQLLEEKTKIIQLVTPKSDQIAEPEISSQSEKSLGYASSEVIASIMVFSIFGIPVIIIVSIILKIKKKITGNTLKIILAGMGVLVLVLIVGMIIAQSSMTDEEKHARDVSREVAEYQKQQLIDKQAQERERELANFEEVYENGRLKYRPYWLVGDGYKELEFTGKITRDSTCANLAEAANSENIFESFYLGVWLGGCVEDNDGDYTDILWKGDYLKYRLHWDRDDINKNIDNR